MVVVAALSAMSVSASITETEKTFVKKPEIMWSQFLAGDEPHLLFRESDGNNITFIIVDNKLNEITRIPFPDHLEYLYPKSEDCDYMNDIVFTQTLFNTDDKYEWIVSKGRGGHEDEWEVVTGFKVMSEDGSTVADVDFPAGYTTRMQIRMSLYILGKELYLFCPVGDSNDDDFYIVYSVSPDNASVQQVGAPRKVSVSPTSMRRGTPVNVNFPAGMTGVTNVKVVSATGAVVMNRNIQPDATSTSIETSSFAPGMYIVNVTDGKTIREAAKIIVR